MNVLLLCDENPRTPHIVRQLQDRGYAPTVLGAIRFVGPNPTKRQLRRAVIKAIMRVDAVCVMSDAPEMAQLARLAVICQWADVALLPLENLPRTAPPERHGFSPYEFVVPVDIDATPVELKPTQRLLRTLRNAWQRDMHGSYARR